MFHDVSWLSVFILLEHVRASSRDIQMLGASPIDAHPILGPVQIGLLVPCEGCFGWEIWEVVLSAPESVKMCQGHSSHLFLFSLQIIHPFPSFSFLPDSRFSLIHVSSFSFFSIDSRRFLDSHFIIDSPFPIFSLLPHLPHFSWFPRIGFSDLDFLTIRTLQSLHCAKVMMSLATKQVMDARTNLAPAWSTRSFPWANVA